MEGSAQFKAKANDLCLPQMDQWRDDFYFTFLCPCLDDLVEGPIVCRATIGVARTVLLDGSYVNLFRAQHLGPTHRNRQKMSVAEGNVGDRDVFPDGMTFRN